VYSAFTIARKFLHYYLTASNGKGHGVHSPFVFDFITQVLNNKNHYYAYDTVEALRGRLKLNKTKINVEDLGAGSVTNANNLRSIASIAANAAKPPKYGRLLFRMVNYYRPTTVLELGTSLGITTSYLSLANPQAGIITLEGSKEIGEKAMENFRLIKLANIKLVHGNFDKTLGKVIAALSEIDMAFVDGNHRREPTLRYFNQLLPAMTAESIMIFDDIHWSAEMEEAWKEITGDPRVMLSVDLFFVGIIFFHPGFKVKQHFTIRF
jgi:predicted O-methyltransferase YrrM